MVVRMRHNRSQRGHDRSQKSLKAKSLATCECGAVRLSHRACPQCGRYRGRVVVDLAKKVQAKATKKAKREASKTR